VSLQYYDDFRTWEIFRGPFVRVRPQAPAIERFQRLPFLLEQRGGNVFDCRPAPDDEPLSLVFELSQKRTDIVAYEAPLRKLRHERSRFAPIAAIDHLLLVSQSVGEPSAQFVFRLEARKAGEDHSFSPNVGVFRFPVITREAPASPINHEALTAQSQPVYARDHHVSRFVISPTSLCYLVVPDSVRARPILFRVHTTDSPHVGCSYTIPDERVRNMQRPLLGFDTSAINALRRDGAQVEPLLAALDAAYAIRLNGTALDEIVAHSVPGDRERLRKLCGRLLANGEGDVLLPFHEITTRLSLAFESGPPFDWTTVDVRSSEYMQFLFGEEIDDIENVSAEQRAIAVETAEQFERVFLDPRPIFQQLRETEKQAWPKSPAELMERLQQPGGAYWNYGVGLYARATGQIVTEEKIRTFVRQCPPFRALLAAIVVAQYDRCIREEVPEKLAGRNDIFMAGYLPYSHEFISNDHPQQEALRQVASIAVLETRVRWYKEFSTRFSLGVAARA